jgi:NADH dehydrogenase
VSLGRWRAAAQMGDVQLYGRFAWWLWRTIYLSKLISSSKKFKVAVNWTVHLFMPRDISQLTEFEYENDYGCGKE